MENTDILAAFQSACNDVYYEQATAKARAATLLKEMKDILSTK
jgi:hypothetical protein